MTLRRILPISRENCENTSKRPAVTVKLELSSEIEAGLVAQAQARGLSLEDYLAQVLQSASEIFPTQAEAIERARKLAAGGNIHIQPHRATRKSLAQLFADSPFKGLDLKFERDADTGRPVKV